MPHYLPSPSAARRARVVIAASAMALTVVPFVVGSPASAAAKPVDATVRAANLSPSMPATDIYIAAYSGAQSLWLDDAGYGDISQYKMLAPGAYTFSVRKHGAAPSSAPLRSWTLTAKAGDAYTAALVGSAGTQRGVVLSDNLTPPPAGRANVRFIQAASRAKTTDVTADSGPVVARDTAFGTTTGYAAIKAGTWPITAVGNGQRATASVSLQAGSVTSILLLDAPGGGTRLTSVVDAAGAAAPPHDAVDAGGGGTAAHVVDRPSDRSELRGLLAGVLVTLALGISFVIRRSTRTRIGR